MSEFAIEMAEFAAECIAEEGRSITIIKFGEDDTHLEFDPRANPIFSVPAEAIFVEPVDLNRLGMSTDSSEIVQNSDKIMLVSPGTTITEDLSTADEVIDGDKRWKITKVEELTPGDTTILYFIGVKR